MDKESFKDLVIRKAEEGMVVFMTHEGPKEADLEEFIKQPTDGLLYDLNRGREVVLSFIDNPKWVNDFAVMLVIAKLKEKIDSLEVELILKRIKGRSAGRKCYWES